MILIRVLFCVLFFPAFAKTGSHSFLDAERCMLYLDVELRDEYFTKNTVRVKLFHFSISPNEMKCENIFLVKCRRDNVIISWNFWIFRFRRCLCFFDEIAVVAVNNSAILFHFLHLSFVYPCFFVRQAFLQQSISLGSLYGLPSPPPRPEETLCTGFVRWLAYLQTCTVYELWGSEHTWEISTTVEGKKTFWFNFFFSCFALNSTILWLWPTRTCSKIIWVVRWRASRWKTEEKKRIKKEEREKADLADGCWLPHTCFVLRAKTFRIKCARQINK